jgi:hypothetical protein
MEQVVAQSRSSVAEFIVRNEGYSSTVEQYSTTKSQQPCKTGNHALKSGAIKNDALEKLFHIKNIILTLKGGIIKNECFKKNII